MDTVMESYHVTLGGKLTLKGRNRWQCFFLEKKEVRNNLSIFHTILSCRQNCIRGKDALSNTPLLPPPSLGF